MKRLTLEIGKDRLGELWHVIVVDEKAYPAHWAQFLARSSGRVPSTWDEAIAKAQITFIDRTTAKLDDIRVDSRIEDRHVGSILLASVEEYATARGIQHFWGDISLNDRDHFGKLEHFYQRNGWTWVLFPDRESSGGRHSRVVGRVEKNLTGPT